MNYVTTTTFATVGQQEITPGFQAGLIEVSVSPANGAAFQGVQHCFGWTDTTRKMCDFAYLNPANGRAISGKTTQKLLQLWGEDAMGNLVVILEATLNSVSATKVKFDIAVANLNYQVSIKCQD